MPGCPCVRGAPVAFHMPSCPLYSAPAIKQCPLCAHPAELTIGGASIWIECKSCGAAGPHCVTEARAIASWNYRTEEICPGHVASESDPKICGRCGIHVDALRPN